MNLEIKLAQAEKRKQEFFQRMGIEKEEDLDKYLPYLNWRQDKILCMRLGIRGYQPHTLAEIGAMLNRSQELVRSLESKAKRRMVEIKNTLNKKKLVPESKRRSSVPGQKIWHEHVARISTTLRFELLAPSQNYASKRIKHAVFEMIRLYKQKDKTSMKIFIEKEKEVKD